MTTIRIGLFGLRGAGKTVALSVLYLTEYGDELELTVRDAASLKYLRRPAEALQRGNVPEPTMVAEPRALKWSARLQDTAYDLETIDFAGELLDMLCQDGDAVTAPMMEKLHRQIRDWFVTCDAVILFIDGTDHGTARYRDALVWLLDELSVRPTIRGTHQRPVAVVFTKADEIARSPDQLLDPDKSQPLLENHPLYHIVQRRVGQKADNLPFRVFLTSALGWGFYHTRDRSSHVKPCNLFEFLRWSIEGAATIVEPTHRQVLDEFQQDLRQRKDGDWFFAWALIQYRQIQTMFEATDRHYQLSRGPYAEQFHELRAKVQRTRVWQFCAVTAATIAALLLVVCGLWYDGRRSRIRAYEAYEGLPRATKSDLEKAISRYESDIAPIRTSWFWALADYRDAAETQFEHDQDSRGELLAKEAYVIWEADDKKLKTAGRPSSRYLAAQSYLREHDARAPKELVTRVHHVLEETQPAYERMQKLWTDTARLPASTVRDCKLKLDRLAKYRALTDTLYGDQASHLVNQTELAWYRLLISLPTSNRAECDAKAEQLKTYTRERNAGCRKQARQWLDVYEQGTKYLNDTLGKSDQDYWELSTGAFSFNLNPMFAFVDDKWQVRCKKSDPWIDVAVAVPASGSGEAATRKILDRLGQLNAQLPAP